MSPSRARWMRPLALAASLACLSSASPVLSQVPAPSPEKREEARARFDRGTALFNEGDGTGALAEFSRAWELVPNPVILYNIGLVHASLGHPVQAVETLDRVIAAPGTLSAERLAKARTVRDEQAKRIATLQLTGLPAGAVVEIDNVRVATAPLSGPLRIASGTRLVGVIAPGHIPFRKEVTVAGEVKLDLPVELTPLQQSLAHVRVRTLLPGADVFVDGQPAGKTPLATTLAIAPGRRRIEVRRPGYHTAWSDLSLAEGATGEVSLEPQEDPSLLTQEGGTLALSVGELKASVTVDGKPQPGFESGLRLARGLHVVRVEASGFLPSERLVDVTKGANTFVRVQLVPTPDTIAKQEASVRSRRLWGWSAVVGGVVLAGGGVGWLAINAGRIDDAQKAKDDYERDAQPGQKCDTKTAPEDAVYYDCLARKGSVGSDLDSAKQLNAIGYVGIGVGAAVLVTGAVLLLTGEDPDKYKTKSTESIASGFRYAPLFWSSPKGGGLGLRGVF